MNNGIPKMIKNKGDVFTQSGEVRSFYAHTHTYVEIILYEKFIGKVYVGNNGYNIFNKTAFIISALDLHRVEVENSLGAKFIKICVDFGGEIEGVNSFILEEVDDFLIELFYRVIDETDVGYKTAITKLIYYHIKKHGVKLYNASGNDIVINAINYISSEYLNGLTLKKIASKIAVTPEYLSGVFSKSVGVTVSKYILNLKLDKAKELLRETSKSVTEICYDSGFGNLSHFLRTFTKTVGVSPLNYRKNFK